MKTYASIYDNPIRDESSSGGIFSLLSMQFDVTYGVSMSQDCYRCEFIRTERDIAPLRGSKYFQAHIGNAFCQVKQDLLSGKKVLFSGTGCQINGLAMYLGQEYNNLFLLEVVCHGVPSPILWKKYVKYQEESLGKIYKVNFRDKSEGWFDYGLKVNENLVSHKSSIFMQMFLHNLCLRPACYDCHAKKMKMADMAIADFWGIDEIEPEMNDNRGTSAVICRSCKGELLFELIKPDIKMREVTYEEIARHNPSEYRSVVCPEQRDWFYKDLKKFSIPQMEEKYLIHSTPPLRRRIVRKVKQELKKHIKVSYFGIYKSNIPELFSEKKDCCGCSACYSICPLSAISMKADKEGFEYPIINKNICIRCGRCLAACPVKHCKENVAKL